MSDEWTGPLKDLYMADTRKLTDEQLRRIREADDDELMRMSGTAHLVPVVESMRRLRERIHGEERAIKWLTWMLVVLTGVLVIFGIIDYRRRAAEPNAIAADTTTYRAVMPDGKTYKITGPKGESDEAVKAEIARQHPEANVPATHSN